MREGEMVADLDGAQATELEVLRHAMPSTQEMVATPAPPTVATDRPTERRADVDVSPTGPGPTRGHTCRSDRA